MTVTSALDAELIPQDPPRDILFLRLKGPHLSKQRTVFYSVHDALLRVKRKMLSATRVHKGLIKVSKRLPVKVNLVCQLVLGWDVEASSPLTFA